MNPLKYIAALRKEGKARHMLGFAPKLILTKYLPLRSAGYYNPALNKRIYLNADPNVDTRKLIGLRVISAEDETYVNPTENITGLLNLDQLSRFVITLVDQKENFHMQEKPLTSLVRNSTPKNWSPVVFTDMQISLRNSFIQMVQTDVIGAVADKAIGIMLYLQ